MGIGASATVTGTTRARSARRRPSLPRGSVLAGLGLSQGAFFLTTVFLHRALSHRALTLHPAARAACRVGVWLLTGIRPRQWVAVHRRHHAFTDIPGDPHSPLLEGFWAVLLGNAVLYRRAATDGRTVDRYAKDLPSDGWDRAVFDRGALGLACGAAILVSLLGWRRALGALGVHAATYLLGCGAINAVGHRFGRRPFTNTATNSQWLAWLVAGEGLHNNHHGAPTSARLAVHAGEVDPGWWAVRALARCGLARVRPLRDRAPMSPAA